MARNKVQFQRGLSEVEFERRYGTEEKCRVALFAWRWPEGFECPACGGFAHCVVEGRGRSVLYQCNACRTQTSLTAGTIFASTKLELTIWFRAMYHLTQTKQGISSLELSRRLGVSYGTAWKIHHKLAQAMMERDEGRRLEGRIEMDDAYLGGRKSGGKRGRGSPGKLPFVAAVETTGEGKPVRLKLRRVRRFKKARIKQATKAMIKPGSTVVTDGYRPFRGVVDAGCTHIAIPGSAHGLPAAMSGTRPSSGSTPCSATSRTPLPRPTASPASTPRGGWQSSSIGSTAASILPR